LVGPNVSLEAGCVIENARISDSIVQSDSIVKNTVIAHSLIGKNVTYSEKPRELSLGDFSTQS
jgi:glucose-1-phosphate thymidylyltransferase